MYVCVYTQSTLILWTLYWLSFATTDVRAMGQGKDREDFHHRTVCLHVCSMPFDGCSVAPLRDDSD